MSNVQQRTKRAILQGFLELLNQKSFEKITTNDICESALVHRSTFYRYYTDKYSLLKEFAQTMGEDLVDRLSSSSSAEFSEVFVQFIFDNKKLFFNIADQNGNMNSLMNQTLSDILYERSSEISEEIAAQINASSNPPLYARFFASGLGEIIASCVRDNDITRQQLKMFIEEIINKKDNLR